MACSVACGGTQTSLGKCTPLLRKGGGKRLIGFTCDTTFTLKTDSAEWGTLFASDKAFFSPEGRISKDRGSATAIEITSAQQAVTGWEETVKFITYDSEADFSDYDFYESLQERGGSGLILGYLTEDDDFYQLPNVSVQPNDVREESSKLGNTYWEVDLIYRVASPVKPINIAGLNDVIDALL